MPTTPSLSRTALEPSTSILLRQLQALRQRQLFVGIVTSILWGIFTATCIFLFCVWIDLLWEVPPAVRRFVFPLTGIAALATSLGLIVGQWTRSGLGWLADQADRVSDSGGEFRTGLELFSTPRQAPPLTTGLAQMAVDRAGADLQQVHHRDVIPLRPLLWAGCTVLVLLSGIALACGFLPKLAQTQWQRFTAPTVDTPPYTPIEFDISPGNTEITYGSNLDIKVTTSQATVDPLKLVLRAEDGQEEVVPMFAMSDREWQVPLTRVTKNLDYFVRAGRARSSLFKISLLLVPELREANYLLTPPSYTNLSPRNGKLAPDSLTGLPGTNVQLTIASNRPLQKGEILFDCGGRNWIEQLQPLAQDPLRVTGNFLLTAGGKYEIRVTDIEGRNSQQTLAGTIVLTDDQRPFVRLSQPKQYSLATPTAIVPLMVLCEDDYGISNLMLFRSLNNSRPSSTLVPVPESVNRWQHVSTLSLAEYGVNPGDIIEVFARVEDNDPAGAKGSESPIHTIQIISQTEFDELQQQQAGFEALTKKMAEIQRRLAAVKHELEALEQSLEAQDQPISEEALRKLKELRDLMRAEADEIKRLSQQKLPLDLEQELEARLQELADAMQSDSETLDELLERADREELTEEQLKQALEEMRNQRQDQQEQFDQQVQQPIEQLAKALPLMALQEQFVRLVLHQRELANRSKSLADRDGVDDPAVKRRLAEMADEQDQLHEKLNYLLSEIETAALQLPELPDFDRLRETALEFVDAVTDSGALEEQDEATLAFSDLVGSRGHRHADEAATILESFVDNSEGMGQAAAGAAEMAFNPAMGRPGLGKSIEQLKRMMGLPNPGGIAGGGRAGGGFSQSRTGLNNMGMYGNQPNSERPMSGQGEDRRGNAATIFGQSTGSRDGQANIVSARDAQSGARAFQIPQKYERRVSEYFRRLVDELGDEAFATGDKQ